jgi:hypothetical protein
VSDFDPEVVDLLADRPDLLAVADAVASTQPRPHRSGRWRLLAVAATIGVAVVVAIVAPWHGHGGGVVQRALAAVGDKPVLHAVIESSSLQQSILDLKTGAERPATQSEEYWFDPARDLLRFKSSVEGRVIAQGLVGKQPGYSPGVNPALEAFVSGYRQALSSGKAHEVGRGIVAGRSAIWVRIDFNGSRERVAIDAVTYRPIEIEELDAKGRVEPLIWHVLAIDTRPKEAADFTAPSAPAAVSGGFRPSPSMPPRALAHAVGWTPVWLGESFGRLPLTSAQVQRATLPRGVPASQRSGVLLSYDDGSARIFIQEALRPGLGNGFFPSDPLPPRGHALITNVIAVGTACKAQLQAGGVWVTITASGTNACELAAHALVPIGSPLVNQPFSLPVGPAPPAPSSPSRAPTPAVCARAWNGHASPGARQTVGDDRPMSALVRGGSIGSLSFSFGGKTSVSFSSGCFITFILPGNSLISASGALINGTVPRWNGPLSPAPRRGSTLVGNASVSADGTVHLR